LLHMLRYYTEIHLIVYYCAVLVHGPNGTID